MSTEPVDPDDFEDEDLDEAAPPASTVEYIRAEHVAGLRVANAGRGVDEMARLVRLGTILPDSLEAARAELEAARHALGLVHATPIGEVPSAETYTAMAVDPKTMPYLRKPLRTGSGMSYPRPPAEESCSATSGAA